MDEACAAGSCSNHGTCDDTGGEITVGSACGGCHKHDSADGTWAAGEVACTGFHGANRLGASALMQGLADGYFVIPYTLGEYLASVKLDAVSADQDECSEVMTEVSSRTEKLLSIKGSRSVDSLHRELGMLMLDECGMARNEKGLEEAIEKIRALKAEFWSDVRVTGEGAELNQELEKAGRVADFFELAELMCRDALERTESCGGHFREESQTDEGEALRDDENFTNVTVWEYKGEDTEPVAHTEDLVFETVTPTQRSYK